MAIDQGNCTAYIDMVDLVAIVSATSWLVLMFLKQVEDNVRLPYVVNTLTDF